MEDLPAILDVDVVPVAPPVSDFDTKPYTAPDKQIWGWALGRVSEFGLVSSFGQAMAVFSIGYGLSPMIVGFCMSVPRLLDGLIDPILGHWSDDTHTRWGRRKPFMIGGALLGAMFLTALWWANPSWSPVTQLIYLTVVGSCLYACYGAYAMAWTAIGYELIDDYHERSRVASIGGYVLAAMLLMNSGVYWLALRPIFGDVIWGMRWIEGAMAVLIIVFAFITCSITRERFTQTNRKHVPLLPAVRTTLKNKAFVYLLLMKISEIFGGRLTGGLAMYLGTYYVCRGDQSLATGVGFIGGTLGTIWNFAMMPLVKPTSKLIGKRGALIISNVIGVTMALIAPFITTPRHPYWGLIPGLIVAPLLVITGTIAGAILPDICDVDELQTGQRREGLFSAVMGFVSKLEISLAVGLVGIVLWCASVDTRINRRWEMTIDGHTQQVNGFQLGELAVFRFKDLQPMTFDTLTIQPLAKAGNGPQEVELSASNSAPTEGFTPLGRFHATSSGLVEAHFSSTKAKYFKVLLVSGRTDATLLDLSTLSLVDSSAPQLNVLSAERGAKVAAAQPPTPVTNRLYWLVMIPGIGFAIITLIMTLLFPLTEAKMLEVRRQLDERRLQGEAGTSSSTR